MSGGYHPDDQPHTLVLNDGSPVRIGRSGLSLRIFQKYSITRSSAKARRFRISTRSYAYTIYRHDTEIIGYHYHPDSGVDFCHLHLRSVSDLAKIHLPTGRIAIEQVIAMLIRDFRVRPRRDDYDGVLQDGLAKFRSWRTWS